MKMASASAAVARAKKWILEKRKDKKEQAAELLKLRGLDYLAVKRNPTTEEKELVAQHENTRLSRSRARIEAEFTPILQNDMERKRGNDS